MEPYKELAKLYIEQLELFIKVIERYELTNEQWFIEFEDSLNKLSTKDHNIKDNVDNRK